MCGYIYVVLNAHFIYDYFTGKGREMHLVIISVLWIQIRDLSNPGSGIRMEKLDPGQTYRIGNTAFHCKNLK
jgi:hypothetical protein